MAGATSARLVEGVMIVTQLDVAETMRALEKDAVTPVARALEWLEAGDPRPATCIVLAQSLQGSREDSPWIAPVLRGLRCWRTFLAVSSTAPPTALAVILRMLLEEEPGLRPETRPIALALLSLVSVSDDLRGWVAAAFKQDGHGPEERALIDLAAKTASPMAPVLTERLRVRIERALAGGAAACFREDDDAQS